MNTSTESNRLQVSRWIKASPARVFAAWTRPEQMQNWFGPSTCKVLGAETDVRVGGSYRIKIRSERMGDTAVGGEYLEVAPPHKLVFTWRWENDADWENVRSVVTIDFIAKEGGTEVQLTHEGFPNAESRGNHEHGWDGSLDKLVARAAAFVEVNGPGHFSWNELLVDDVDKAGAFYTKLLGWQTAPMQAGDMPYILFKQRGSDVGGLMKAPMPGIPAHWLSYITVEAVDAVTARVVELGGIVCAPPFDIPTVGRISVVQDPQGARFGLFQPAC
ncbi:MAG TPA: SRPBCC domain-containing protein [Chthoniobacteraceae bacterium]|jgi:uncharacterized protein YndB with AHSA1/START domain/predicted enzyme related to lactoylglutathione lyase